MNARSRARLERIVAEGRAVLMPLKGGPDNDIRQATQGMGGLMRDDELRHVPIIGDTTKLFVTLTKGGRGTAPGRKREVQEARTEFHRAMQQRSRRQSKPLPRREFDGRIPL